MFKQTLIVASLLSLLVAGCSSDQRYKREVDGNDEYLKATELKPLIVPKTLTVPAASNEYYIFPVTTKGEVGKAVDIRPPSLPLPTIADSYVTYQSGMIKFDSPSYANFWSQIPAILSTNNISAERNDSSVIKTGTRFVYRTDDPQPVEASYLLQRKLASGREYITLELVSLQRMGQDIPSAIERQYYTNEFFNLLMRSAVVPSQNQAVN
ncbi:outer membrane protein assembly factor BamC [Orbus hercynius]|uniref:Outer membrane protein assembly factor BamC n=1 Tax=Orbus hercynius TaxID=593135 RepID=A0A495RKF3_9GAMM|nr:outer membrane protein assembly factor BamC [Orbus hercynius]RKS87780.1 outer membrane protein assembly factor BamC [Orbus hercynius]